MTQGEEAAFPVPPKSLGSLNGTLVEVRDAEYQTVSPSIEHIDPALFPKPTHIIPMINTPRT
jgi:hypothetical protein